MKKTLLCGLSMLICLLSISQELPQYAPGQIIVKVKGDLFKTCDNIVTQNNTKTRNELIEQDSILQKFGIYKIESLHYFDKSKKTLLKSGSEKTFVFYTKETDIPQLIENIKKIADVEDAYPNYLFISHVEPDDGKYDDQWSLPKISMPAAWDIQKGCTDIKIAILDVGFRDLEHNDVDDKFLSTRRDETDIDVNSYINSGFYSTVSGEDYTTPDDNPEGKSFHGLQVSGVAAAETNNNKGIAGVGWDIYIVPVRCGFKIMTLEGERGIFEMDDIIRAIDWIVSGNRARVINMSLGGLAPTGNVLTEYENSLESAYNSGIVIVVSSGNYYHDSPIPISQVAYPASSQFTISVGASNESDNRADFSHYGSDLDIIAPGTNILTVYKKFINKYEKVNVTSFSAPIVSGISALILSQNPELNPEQVRDILIESADKVSGMNGQNFHVEYGFGRVNAKRALEFVPEIKYDITLNNEVITDLQIVNAQNSINASYYSVEPGATVIFKAGNSIDLTDEFNAKEGSNFYAYIDDVGVSCSSKSLKSEKAVDNDTIKKEEIASSEEHMNNNSIPTNVITSENPNIIVFPNPFSENATIQFEIRTNPQIVNIYINDLIGRTIKTIVKSNNNPNGKYSVDFNLSGFKQGIYFVILEIDQQKYARKIIYKQ
ncbi:MAG TPA: S8 family serine peptidase [Bacteroidales bacterium]|nr:S8 family serine peptidase [Bacteroidales bacterium]